MKTLITILTLLICSFSFAQSDSANTKPSVTLQARDIEYIINFTGVDNQFKVMDSVFAKKLSGSGAPSGTTNVQCDSIKAKHWLSIFERIRIDALAQDQGIFSRLRTALNNTAFTWLTVRITKSDNAAQEYQQNLRSQGRRIARREEDNQ